MYRGMVSCFVKTYRTEGVLRGLYAGTTPAIVANVAENSVLFACYGMCQKLVAKATKTDVEDMSVLSNATAGCIASIFSSFALCPTELIKVKLQCSREVASANGVAVQISGVKLTRDILRKEGLFGLFRGFQSTLVREMPGYFVFFGAYEGTRSMLTPTGQAKGNSGPLSTIIAGAIAGISLWLVIYPVDVIKSRIQISQKAVNNNVLTYAMEIARNEGISKLYSGLQPTLVRTVPASAALFLAYEWTNKLLHDIF